ncbi:hypothetical protein COU37_04925 [Candidatus Micrarchaeota archaeon CG10_big_fil_rev_8_21_14_0_10_45_29]|nr:MAG: hypothetical protein COU37_04925 [Candidatus Micrarchaeota archaeon CG10_big_fil_rev_8_21_14_0_10_45_29]
MFQFEPSIAIYLIIFILPAYAANAAPVLLGGLYPIDAGKKFFDKRPIFGKGKTWLGIAGGMGAGLLVAALEAYLLPSTQFDIFGSKPALYLLAGALLSAGALFGDLAGSFIKRRLAIPSGKPSFLDQLTFLFGALLFAFPFGFGMALEGANLIFLIIITYLIHRGANLAAHFIGIKKVPW